MIGDYPRAPNFDPRGELLNPSQTKGYRPGSILEKCPRLC
jgi:hypothetical protein